MLVVLREVRERTNPENWLLACSSLVVFKVFPLLEFLRKRSTQVPYTCRKCIKDQKLISEFWKKKWVSLSRVVSNRIAMLPFHVSVGNNPNLGENPLFYPSLSWAYPCFLTLITQP
jgi:hypothetical protein